jgi:uncharacterized UBP type Zn finger protein
MGFTPNAAKRALIHTKDNLEAATMWIMENMDSPNLNDPLEEDSSATGFNTELIAKIMDLGFDETQAKTALIQNVHNGLLRRTMLRLHYSGSSAWTEMSMIISTC